MKLMVFEELEMQPILMMEARSKKQEKTFYS